MPESIVYLIAVDPKYTLKKEVEEKLKTEFYKKLEEFDKKKYKREDIIKLLGNIKKESFLPIEDIKEFDDKNVQRSYTIFRKIYFEYENLIEKLSNKETWFSRYEYGKLKINNFENDREYFLRRYDDYLLSQNIDLTTDYLDGKCPICDKSVVDYQRDMRFDCLKKTDFLIDDYFICPCKKGEIINPNLYQRRPFTTRVSLLIDILFPLTFKSEVLDIYELCSKILNTELAVTNEGW